MKILISIQEILETKNWSDIYEILGYDYYAPHNGLDLTTKTVELTKEQAQEIGII